MLDKPEIVQFLQELGADSTVRSPEGRTLYEIAQEKGHRNIAVLHNEQSINLSGRNRILLGFPTTGTASAS
jgi:hypothetical protein